MDEMRFLEKAAEATGAERGPRVDVAGRVRSTIEAGASAARGDYVWWAAAAASVAAAAVMAVWAAGLWSALTNPLQVLADPLNMVLK
jgi:hypothetical protein